MKKDIIYFRAKRVGSSKFQSCLDVMEETGIINTWWGKSHMHVDKVKELCIKEKSETYWNQAIKVVGIRNPWAHQVSRFLMTPDREDNPHHPNIDITTPHGLKKLVQDFRELMTKPHGEIHDDYTINNWHIHSNGDKTLADVIIRLEDLEGSLKKLADSLKAPVNDVMTAFKNMIDPNRVDYDTINRYDWKDFYDTKTKNLVYEMRKKEIDHFGYKF